MQLTQDEIKMLLHLLLNKCQVSGAEAGGLFHLQVKLNSLIEKEDKSKKAEAK